VSPPLKAYGIPGRARLFEVIQRVKEVNAERRRRAPGRVFSGSSYFDAELKADLGLEVNYIVARPRMAHYMENSARIYEVYLKYVAAEDMHVYSVDEVFIDATDYLRTAKLSPRDFAMRMILDVLKTTGITAAAGIGPNLYLSKIAMDIGAKHTPADCNGVRIAELDEMRYRRQLWTHRPLTDFWRVGRGYARKLEEHGMFTMGDIARCSVGQPREHLNEDLLYKLFGVNAELLIDHAWGWEPCTIADIKAYRPGSSSISSGQVLQHPYPFEKARLIVREMTDLLVLGLVDKGLATDQMILMVGYDRENLSGSEADSSYRGEVATDPYGRRIPKPAHGSINLGRQTSSTKLIVDAVMELYDRIVDKRLLVRRISVAANRVVEEASIPKKDVPEQLDMFTDYAALQKKREEEEAALAREKQAQKAILDIKKKFGKNAILKGMNLEEGATAMDRNRQIGGHKA
jgi:DNA polymerase V